MNVYFVSQLEPIVIQRDLDELSCHLILHKKTEKSMLSWPMIFNGGLIQSLCIALKLYFGHIFKSRLTLMDFY